jgi:hypothetical protein
MDCLGHHEECEYQLVETQTNPWETAMIDLPSRGVISTLEKSRDLTSTWRVAATWEVHYSYYHEMMMEGGVSAPKIMTDDVVVHLQKLRGRAEMVEAYQLLPTQQHGPLHRHSGVARLEQLSMTHSLQRHR